MRRALLLIIFLILVAIPQRAHPGSMKHLLIHAKTSLSEDDAQLLSIPDIALAALQRGDKVSVLFDASGVTAIKIGSWYGGHTTPLDKRALKEDEREAIAKQLGMPYTNIPDNYGDYFRFLRGRGLRLYANEAMMKFFEIEEDEYDSAVTPVGFDEILEILYSADAYIAY